MYTIGKVSKMFHLPISTLRYYDKEGLLPGLQREASGIRRFDDRSLESLRVIECLKKSGMEIKDIKQFMVWCSEGSATYEKRLKMFQHQKESIENKIAQLQKTLEMVEFKCWYYTHAIEEGNEAFSENMPDSLPEEIRPLYIRSHSD
ncbi:MAG: MerR family transcriptional regulator [Ruminococcus sp.]|jgi:DNA-binding transcriptional MerR regulator